MDSGIVLLKLLIKAGMGKYLKRVICFSILGMLFAAISNANLGIISQFASQNGNTWVGPFSVALLFLGLGLGALKNSYIGKISYRTILFFGASGWNIYLFFSVMFLFIGFSDLTIAVILLGSFICGLMASVYYNGFNNFINQCAKLDNKSGTYFAINICIVQCSNIVGNAISSILIGPLGQKTYSFVMLGCNIFLSFFFLLAQEFPKEESLPQSESLISQEQVKEAEQGDSFGEQKEGTMDRIPKLLFFVFGFSGVMISFVYGEFSIAFYDYYSEMEPEELNKLTFITFMIEGVGELAGGLTLAFFSKKMKKLVLYNTIIGCCFILCVFAIWQGFQHQLEWLIQLMAFVLGFADCFCFALVLSISGRWNQSGISLFNFGQETTVAIMSAFYIFLGIKWAILIYLAYFALSTFVSFRKIKQIEGNHLENQQ